MSEISQGTGADVSDELDHLLRDAAAHEAYIDDAGFTTRVIERLPAAANFALRRWILLGFGAASALAGLLLFGGGAFVWDAALDLVTARRFGSAQFTLLVFALVFYWGLYTGLRGTVDAQGVERPTRE